MILLMALMFFVRTASFRCCIICAAGAPMRNRLLALSIALIASSERWISANVVWRMRCVLIRSSVSRRSWAQRPSSASLLRGTGDAHNR